MKKAESYFVEVEQNGCEHCGAGRLWTVIGPDSAAIGESFERQEDAEERADALEDAYERGKGATREPPAAPDVQALDPVALLKEAKERVRASCLYKRFIDGTPLENDIAVWMMEFAAEKLRAAAPAGEAPETTGPPA